MKRGYVHVYTGDGKGKTTAALGLALRAIGAGLTVFFAQFTKGTQTSEATALSQMSDRITLRRFGTGRFIAGEPSEEDRSCARAGLAEVRTALWSGQYDMVVLDEACVALHLALLSLEDVLEVIRGRPAYVEVVFTGRHAPQGLLDAADLVTEMREVKHYYTAGVAARRGIEH